MFRHFTEAVTEAGVSALDEISLPEFTHAPRSQAENILHSCIILLSEYGFYSNGLTIITQRDKQGSPIRQEFTFISPVSREGHPDEDGGETLKTHFLSAFNINNIEGRSLDLDNVKLNMAFFGDDSNPCFTLNSVVISDPKFIEQIARCVDDFTNSAHSDHQVYIM